MIFNFKKNSLSIIFLSSLLIIVACRDNPINVGRIHKKGINLIGTCSNSDCKAHNKEVISELGFGVFDILKGGNIAVDSNCSACHQPILFKTLFFKNCYYRIRWKKKYGDRTLTSWKYAGNEFLLHQELKNEEKYSNLKVECYELNDSFVDENDKYDF